MDTIY